MALILVIDDEQDMRTMLTLILPDDEARIGVKRDRAAPGCFYSPC